MRHRFEFRSRDLDALERVKWCRANLGTRGERWDFVGGLATVIITIQSDEDAEAYNKAWRFWNVLKGNHKVETHRVS
jgi:hypothetical protein